MRPSRGMGAVNKKKVPKAAKGGFIARAIKKPGALHSQLGLSPSKKIPPELLNRAAKAPGKLGQRARFAKTLKGFNT